MKNLFLSLLVLSLAAFSCSEGGDEPSPEVTLAPPTGLVLKGVTETSATLQWNPVEGATGYAWEVVDGIHIGVYASGQVKTRNVTIPSLMPGTDYTFHVRTVSGEKTGEDYAILGFTTEGSSDQPVEGAVCTDAPLVLQFDSAPVLGSSGLIRIWTDGGKEVDRIDLADLVTVSLRDDGQMVPKEQITTDTKLNTFMDLIPSGNRWRIVHYTPLRIKGNRLEIRHHSGVLEFGKSYYLTMDEDVLAGEPAIAKGEWTFSTKAAPASPASIEVAPDGSADFCTVQGALSYVSSTSGPVTVSVANGTYGEMLFLRERAEVTIVGASREKCVISYANAEALETGSGGSAGSRPALGSAIGKCGGRGMMLFENCNKLRLENITLRNTYGAQGQAEVLYFNSGSNEHRLVIENCALHSLQDTFLTKGEVWVHNSLIAGNVDFIWGYPKACLFEDCEIRCEAPSGYVIQARVPSESFVGFVFLRCDITAGAGARDGSVYLARSAGQSDCFDNVTFIDCRMASVIPATGWYTSPAPNPATPTASSGWKEYGSVDASGKPLSGHNACGRYLSADEAAPYSSRQAVLGW